jgi:hypothetical protein
MTPARDGLESGFSISRRRRTALREAQRVAVDGSPRSRPTAAPARIGEEQPIRRLESPGVERRRVWARPLVGQISKRRA